MAWRSVLLSTAQYCGCTCITGVLYVITILINVIDTLVPALFFQQNLKNPLILAPLTQFEIVHMEWFHKILVFSLSIP